jgi:hypothetical protein
MHSRRLILFRDKIQGKIFPKRKFQCEAFQWAHENKEEARESLAIPLDVPYVGPLSNLEDYLDQRGWSKSRKNKNALNLVSHVLSSPLTLRYLAEQTCPGSRTLSSFHLACIGARSEATLPHKYWRETIMTDSMEEWNVDFIGPDLINHTPSFELLYGPSKITIHHHWKGFFHDIPLRQHKPWTHFILFNPGLNHPNLRDNWLPTLKKLKGKSLWLTAHSLQDAQRDAKLLLDVWNVSVHYDLNPFSSRIVYQDPFDSSHLISPNKFVAHIPEISELN